MNTLIITGGSIDKAFFDSYINNFIYEQIIAVDRGLEFADCFNISIDYIIGDFDSVDNELLYKYIKKGINIGRYPSNKDYTDTHLALLYALENGASNIVIIGATGKRLDHTLGNLHVLMEALKCKVPCKIIDTNNSIQLVDNNIKVSNDFGNYISLIPLTTIVKGINSQGLKYKLLDTSLSIGHSIGISNEILEDYAIIEVKEGVLIIIQSKD